MKTFLSLAIATAALSASPAVAHTIHISDDGGYRISVPYGDLNLASPAGARTLEGRLKAATNAVCGTPRVSGLAEARAVGACRRNVRDVARPQMMLALNGEKGSIALAASR
ncbi:MAG: UrcA family protein [Pseudomonadota bacterium]|nr:UrcA family protein [Pseudomonadota bacterium]